MTSIRELYQEVIIDHGRHPRNYGKPDHVTHQKEGFNPLCGDKVTVFCKFESDILTNVTFEGCGCAISIASASLMSQAVKGLTLPEIQQLFDLFHASVTSDETVSTDALGKLSVLTGVREYPSRVKCATLVWYTLLAALRLKDGEVTTE